MTETASNYSETAIAEVMGAGKFAASAILSRGMKWGHIMAAVDAGHARILPDPVLTDRLDARLPVDVTIRIFF